METINDGDGAAVRLPPPLVPVLAILIGVALGAFSPIVPGFVLPTPERYWIGGMTIAGSLIGLGLWPMFLFRDSGQDVAPWSTTPELVVLGPYRFTRNPMYLMMVLLCIGFTILLSNAWIGILTPICAWALYQTAIKPEEAYLEQKFGASYRAYKLKVRRWI